MRKKFKEAPLELKYLFILALNEVKENKGGTDRINAQKVELLFYKIFGGKKQDESLVQRLSLYKYFSKVEKSRANQVYNIALDILRENYSEVPIEDLFNELITDKIILELYNVVAFSDFRINTKNDPSRFDQNKKQKKRLTYYTSYETGIKILSAFELQPGSLLGQNDPDEFYHGTSIIKPDWISELKSDSKFILELGRNFIVSLSDENDDLTMWRLYGNDADSMSLEFEIDIQANKNDSNSMSDFENIDHFDLIKIDYLLAENNELAYSLNQKFTGSYKDLPVKDLRELIKICLGYKTKFYKDEKETRILVTVDKDNLNKIHTSNSSKAGYSRIHTIVKFGVSEGLNFANKNNENKFDFSDKIKLKTITLGPKKSETHLLEIRQLLYLKAKEIFDFSDLKDLNSINQTINDKILNKIALKLSEGRYR